MFHKEGRSLEQWKVKQKYLTKIIGGESFKDDEDLFILNNLQKKNQDLNNIFSKLIESTAPELEQRLANQMSVRSQEMVLSASKLSEKKNAELFSILIRTSLMVLGMVLLIIIIILSVFFFFYTQLIGSIKLLHQAAEELEKGNFKARVNIKSKDELQELGETFNKTITALSQTKSERKGIESAKTRFLSITSHELRSPMTPLKAQLQMLEGEYFGKLNEKQKEAISIVVRNADHLDRIIVDFLEISRIEAARLKFLFEKVSLNKSVNDLLTVMKMFMPEKKIKIVSKIPKLPVIEVDAERVNQVLRNLVNNAIKFSKDGGSVEVIAKVRKDNILFSVKDQGIGMKEEDQRRIFEPFYQAEQTMYRKKGGTGLGLAICRGIVESQNGKIWLNSEVGKGTTFYFTVPFIPVRKIKPIKLLFSTQEGVEKKLKELFKEFLGPIGEKEFEDFKKEGLEPERILQYFEDLKQHGIIDETRNVGLNEKINSEKTKNSKEKEHPV